MYMCEDCGTVFDCCVPCCDNCGGDVISTECDWDLWDT